MKRFLSIFLALLLCFSALSTQALAVSGSDVVSEATALIGKYPYVSGGRSPSNGGFDCSGLIYYVYHTRLGYNVTYEQIWSRSVAGTKITNKSDLLPGDMIFGLNSSGGWHAGIYSGNSTMIHSGSSKGVSRTSINATWFTFKFAIRPSGVSQGTTTNTSTTNTSSQNTTQLTATETSGDWFVYVPANYKLLLYSSAASTSSVTYCSARSSSYRIVCSKKSVLSNGTVRYCGVFNTNDYYWFTYNDGMTIKNAEETSTCVVTFDANGGKVSESSKTVKVGSTYGTLPTPTNSFKYRVFDGWYTAATGGTKVTETSSLISNSNHTLYAHWSIRYITVTFDPNGGKLMGRAVEEISWWTGLQSGVIRSGYTFAGWYTERNGGTKVTYVDPGENFDWGKEYTLYAHWTKN